jgi:HNH endonuclease
MPRSYKPLPPAERLRELLRYDPDDGTLRWRVDRTGWTRTGDIAGRRKKSGRIDVGIDGSLYVATRIIFKMVTGRDPVAQIDHIDMDPSNNRWGNLRQASHAQNQANTVARSASRLKGAYKAGKRFTAAITVDGVTTYLGCFKTAEEAHECWWRETLALRGAYARKE